MSGLALALSAWGRPLLAVDAAQVAKAAFDAWRPDDERTLTAISNLGAVFGEAGQRLKSLAMAEEAWEGRKVVLGPEHPRHAGQVPILLSGLNI